MKIEKLTVNYHGIPVGVLSLTPDIVYVLSLTPDIVYIIV